MSALQKSSSDIDESLYSRQLYVLGHSAMRKMAQTNVLVVGAGGVAAEAVKNIVLSGVRSVTIADSSAVEIADLGTNFFLHEGDVGQNKAAVTASRAAVLNEYVQVRAHPEDVTEEFLKQFQVVLYTNKSICELADVNAFCRANGIKFVATEIAGVMASLFVDVGEKFEIHDVDGEEPAQVLISTVTKENPGAVTCHDEQRHGLETGDLVQFAQARGMTELNTMEPVEINVTGPYTFTICDTTGFGDYIGGGYVRQVKKTKVVDFKSLAESINEPEFLVADFAKFDWPAQLHTCFQALAEFRRVHHRNPRPYNVEDANAFLASFKALNAKASDAVRCENVNETLVQQFSWTASGEIAPITAYMGGYVAQEVLKSCSGKFHPTKQWFYYDATELLPKEPYPESEVAPAGSRYDRQVAVLGRAMQQKLGDLRSFVVGAGAIGCELLKNMALLGAGCGPGGKIFLTDMDSIEVSNLNRQFLFRREHVGKLKSETAGNAARSMNPNMNVHAMSDKLSGDTENIFDDNFWENLHVAMNALDNVETRRYVDSRCVYYQRPLLDSGTLGPKGHVQVVAPFVTESYSSSNDPPEKQIPICTLKNFPNAIEHTIQWAREQFELFYKKTPDTVNSFLSNADFMNKLKAQPGSVKDTLELLVDALVDNRPVHFDACIVWARLKFEEAYHNQISQLLHNFPLDMVTNSGAPFWSGPKRPPMPLQFDPSDETHMAFVVAAANLRAEVFGLKGMPGTNLDYFRNVLATVMVPEFTPRDGVKIQVTEGENEHTNDDTSAIDELTGKLPAPSELAGYRLAPVDFEKDDDTNFHIAFVTAASNLRARNYKIDEADFHATKRIAGKIIPAMITTTALIAGLQCLEMLKVIDTETPIEKYKNAFVNLALPLFAFSEPLPPASDKYNDTTFSMWDRFDIDEGRELTLSEFIDYFQNRHELEITMLGCGSAMIYSFFMPKKKVDERMVMKMSDLVSTITKNELDPKQKYLNFEICCNDREGEDCEVPTVRYKYRF